MATKTYEIPSWLRMGVPGICAGQIIECSYGIDLQSGVVVRRCYDRSDRSESWAIAPLTDEEMVALETYEPGGAGDEPSVEAPYVEVVVTHEQR